MNQASKLSFFVFFSPVIGLVPGFLFGLTNGPAEEPEIPTPLTALSSKIKLPRLDQSGSPVANAGL